MPKPVEALHGKHIVDVSVGPSHFLAVTKTGAVYSWGWNEHGQLGHHDNSSTVVVAKPSRVNTPTVAGGCHVAVHCGPSQVRYLLTAGQLFCLIGLLCVVDYWTRISMLTWSTANKLCAQAQLGSVGLEMSSGLLSVGCVMKVQ